MAPLLLPSNDQKLAAAAELQQVQMWQAAQTVRSRVPDQEGREELLACLGLSDVVRPAGR